MWPYFDVAHCIMACLAVREDLGTGKYEFGPILSYHFYAFKYMVVFSNI